MLRLGIERKGSGEALFGEIKAGLERRMGLEIVGGTSQGRAGRKRATRSFNQKG